MKYLIILLLLVGCTYNPITMSEIENHTGQRVEIIGSFFDDYNKDYKQFADRETYIYVKTKGEFAYRQLYFLKGKVDNCTIKEGKERICLKANKIEKIN